MTRDEILAAFDRIRVWQQGDRRAVHKPLLVLLALDRLLRGEAPLVEFAGIEDKLGKLLEEFGPSGSEKTRHNPFWHLRTDGVWQLAGPAEITSRPAGATPTITELRQGRVAGGFAEPGRLALARDPALVAEIARRILNAHFPESIRRGRCRRPLPRCNREQARSHNCCVCGHDLRTCGHEWVATSGPGSRAHQVVPGPRAGRGAKRPRAVFPPPQDLRPRRVHRVAGEPPDRVQPPPPR